MSKCFPENTSTIQRYPPNIKIWLVSQFWHPRVGALTPLWMLILHTIQSLTYKSNARTYTINAYPNVNMLVIFTHKYKDSLTLRHPPNINISPVSQFVDTHKWVGSLILHHGCRLFVPCIHLYTGATLVHTPSFISWCEHVFENDSIIISNNSHTVRYPPNINTWLVAQCRYPQVGSLIPIWMLIIHTVHSTYIDAYTIMCIPMPNCFYDNTSTIQKIVPPWDTHQISVFDWHHNFDTHK